MIRLLLIILALVGAGPALAQSRAVLPHTTVELIADSDAPGSTLTVGFAMTPKPGWHTYWKNPGDAGMETRATWTLPPGATAGELRYPTPGTLIVAGLMNHVYDRENVLLADLKLPAAAPGTRLPIAAKLDWLVCDDEICVPESATLSLDLVAGNGARSSSAPRIDAARAALPQPLDQTARFAFKGDRFVLAVPFAGGDRVRAAHFFPAEEGVLAYAAPQVVGVAGNALRIETKADSARDLTRVSGVLRLEMEGRDRPLGLSLLAEPGSVPDGAAALPAAGSSGGGADQERTGAGQALLLAVLGGLLLNIMPCVFPILSLKALSLARAGIPEAEARREAFAYTAGVVLTCVALGGVILALRAAGEAVGWAFQLQDPRVILALMLLTLAIGLNLAGLFEVRGSVGNLGGRLAAKGGTGGAFWTGALAAFVATPCTGPFMGAALGAAIVLPPLAGLAVFAGLGLGLALPFLAVGFVPALRRRLPRPGAWMDRLRRILSVPMFLTALALAWVLGRQTGVNGMTLGLSAALLVGLLLWWLGRRQAIDAPRPALAPLAGGLAVAVAAALALGRVPAEAAPAAQSSRAEQPFSAARLDALRAEGKPTFVYFTADWCITCKVNERGALASERVRTAFRNAGVEILVGDWTDGDPAIARFLESQGRSGVPLYLFYRPDGSTRTLPQLLTPDMLIDLTKGLPVKA